MIHTFIIQLVANSYQQTNYVTMLTPLAGRGREKNYLSLTSGFGLIPWLNLVFRTNYCLNSFEFSSVYLNKQTWCLPGN